MSVWWVFSYGVYKPKKNDESSQRAMGKSFPS